MESKPDFLLARMMCLTLQFQAGICFALGFYWLFWFDGVVWTHGDPSRSIMAITFGMVYAVIRWRIMHYLRENGHIP